MYKRQIVGSQNAGGVLFNLQGQVIGIITNGKSATDMKNMVCAYGITELKRHIEKMSNGEKFAYLGLKGVDVTEEANSELGVPYGCLLYTSGVDWFNNVNESKNQSSGVIIAQNGKQLLILTDYSPVKQVDDIIVTFNEGTQADASLKEKDETTGLAVIADVYKRQGVSPSK